MSTIPTNSLSAFYTPSVGAQSGTLPTLPTSAGEDAGESSFESVLKNAVGAAQQLDTSAQQQVTQLAQGDRQDIHSVMIAVEKADVAFQLMMQVRNKIVNAYQEVSKMQF
jgi:flagellar hook-basal body complex protein FliE